MQLLHPRRIAGRALCLAAALALAVPATAGVNAGAATQPGSAEAGPPITLWAPTNLTVHKYGSRTYTDFGLRVIAHDEPFELWSKRPSYHDLIETEWRSAAGTVALPDGSMRDFSGLSKFLTIKIQKAGSDTVRTLYRPACLSGWSERVNPDAPPRSPYPGGCWTNPYSLGSVQGVQEGWATSPLARYGSMRLATGRYTVTARIAWAYARVLGLSEADATRTIKLTVQEGDDCRGCRGEAKGSDRVAQPAAHEPTSASSGRVAGPVPDLRSVPAWGINVAPNGNYLRFAATVWNAGNSPLVVDGFRRAHEDEMDAYQYFFDSEGNQTGYERVGSMHWDARSTHQHWHFEDFARYSLLDASKVEAVRSKKEAFCLANTDSVDTTVPDASWNPENTDLETSCGEYSSLSIREVLASGWGDTYAQYRAGQSFDLRGLRNGTYYIAVIANPMDRLVEASTTNNVALRKVFISGQPGNRKVRVPQVGIVEEPNYFD